MGPGDGFRIYQTNSEDHIEITDDIRGLDGKQWFDSTGRASLAMTGDNCNQHYRDTFTPLTVAFYDSGILLVACVYRRGSEHYINFRIQVPQPYSGRTRGFFGNFDNNNRNEFYARDENNPRVDNFGRDGRKLFDLLNTCKFYLIAL